MATIKDRFREISKNIVEKVEQNIEFENDVNDIIKLKKPENIILKKGLIEELGFSNLETDRFEPNYNYYRKEDNIIVRIEAPGNCSIQTSIDYIGEYTVIRLSGNKNKDKEPEKLEDNIFNCRNFGSFSFDIPLNAEDYLLKNEEPKIEVKRGLYILIFKLDEKRKGTGEGYKVSKEEEV